jgi:hypothetical protein
MIDLAKPFLRQVTYLLNFKSIAQKIRFEQARAEEVFASFIGVQSQQTNLPDDADPSMARIIFQGSKKQIAISQLGCQIVLTSEDAQLPLAKQLEMVKSNIAEFHSKSLEYKNAGTYGMAALIMEICFSSKTSIPELQDYLYSKFIQTPRIGEVASVQVNLGYKMGSYFLNFGANVYEMRKFELAGGENKIVKIEDLSVQDFGLVFKIDINNRPLMTSNASKIAESPVQIFSLVDGFLGDKFEKISGLKIS